ncbi:hypothetical protein [Microbacterium pygmaeum]|uniref:Uncharacterized protein n=1 Tax=Microbacterium pygmaeum TaxID=370764 RepID=A0A1G7YJ51_9MICO|nr:hypothetical protein [Microbacterium pygmaeum]SDG96295.1 hypothetical protein SAMN04489810_1768 [Microbacterium pygmaeum]
MDASPLPPEFARELETLRRRAYGLDADIDADPVALRRLDELEARTHPLVVADVPDELSDPLRRTPHVPPEPKPSPPPRRNVFVIGVVLLLLWAANALTVPHGEAVLVPTDSTQQERQDIIDLVDLTSFGMVGAQLESFGAFRELSVWSAVDDSGLTCLLVGSEADGLAQVACTPAPLQPSLDLRVGERIEAASVGGLGAGSVVRFAMDGHSIEVWTAEVTVDPR